MRVSFKVIWIRKADIQYTCKAVVLYPYTGGFNDTIKIFWEDWWRLIFHNSDNDIPSNSSKKISFLSKSLFITAENYRKHSEINFSLLLQVVFYFFPLETVLQICSSERKIFCRPATYVSNTVIRCFSVNFTKFQKLPFKAYTEKAVPKNFAKFTRKDLFRSLFFQ